MVSSRPEFKVIGHPLAYVPFNESGYGPDQSYILHKIYPACVTSAQKSKMTFTCFHSSSHPCKITNSQDKYHIW